MLLKIAGMPWYDAVIHAFSSAGTGGFSNRNASVGAYGSVAIDLIITVFILLFSVNFALYFLLLTRKFREVLASDELRFFLTVVAGSTLLICLNIRSLYSSLCPGSALCRLPGGLHHLHHRLCHGGLCPVAPAVPVSS